MVKYLLVVYLRNYKLQNFEYRKSQLKELILNLFRIFFLKISAGFATRGKGCTVQTSTYLEVEAVKAESRPSFLWGNKT
jgi:hypothetical protein